MTTSPIRVPVIEDERRYRDSLGEDPRAPRHVLTRRGYGYCMLATPETD